MTKRLGIPLGTMTWSRSAWPVRYVESPGVCSTLRTRCTIGRRMSASTRSTGLPPSWDSVIARLVTSEVLPSSGCSDVIINVFGGRSGVEYRMEVRRLRNASAKTDGSSE